MSSSSEKKSSVLVQTLKEFAAGTIAGWAQVLSGQPFDIVKVRLQTQSQTNPIYSSALDCFQKILKNEGPYAFYKGTLSPLIGVGAAVSIQFGVNEMCKRLFKNVKDEKGKLKYSAVFMSGALAGVANAIVLSPVEHIRIRLQIQSGEKKLYTGSIDCTKKIYSQHGLSGIYKGLSATIYREFLAFGFYFLTYEWYMRQVIPEGKSIKDIPLYHPLIGGAIAGEAYWLSCFPIDLLKSKLQSDSWESPKYKNLVDCYAQTKKNGIGGFYQGIGPCLLRAMPVNAITFLVFELSLKALGGRAEQ